jgi:biotin carboxyl carrier protein
VDFRFKALAKQREADELDTPTVLTSPRGWLTLLCLATVTLAAVSWAVFGRLPQTVSAGGLITRPHGTAQVQSLYAGLVTAVNANIGGQVRAGQEVAVVADARGARHRVVSLFAGQVIGMEITEGEVIGPGTTVATIERSAPAGGQPVAMLFASPRQVAGIVPGQGVTITVASAPSVAFGLLRGRVLAVSGYPLTAAEISALFAGVIPAGTLAADEGKLLVTVGLRRDSHTASGYSWTTAAGPPHALPLLVPVTGTIALGEQVPISVLFHG